MQKKNKGLKIAIITILILIILLIVVMASLFLFTDILKSDKEMFITYGTKIFSNEEGIIDNDLIQYIEKKKREVKKWIIIMVNKLNSVSKKEMRKNKKMNEDTKSLPSTNINW